MKAEPLLPDNRPQPQARDMQIPHIEPRQDQLPVVPIDPSDVLAAQVTVLIAVRSEE